MKTLSALHLSHFVVLFTLILILGCGGAGGGSSTAKGTYNNIYDAIRANDLAAVQAFVKQGVNVNDKDAEGKTPLHYAAAYGNKELVQFLIDQGADVKAKDSRGRTPMSVASQMGNTLAEEVLDRAGASE